MMFHPIRGNRVDVVFAAVELAMRETALFAGAGFLLLGAGDLAVDLLWIGGGLRRRRLALRTLADLPPPRAPGRLVLFVPAWDEGAVIAPMLRAALAAWGEGDYLFYVGAYPNDAATIAAVRSVGDERVRLVVGPVPGPTTKADCLNRLWEALLADESRQGWRAKAVALHDAEDVVHSAERRLFDALVERYDLVQLPVVPLIDRRSRFVGGHYADEFGEAHGKELVVRQALGAGLPAAGVGCAIGRDALARIAARHGGLPFDPACLTEDYELGLRLREAGGRAAFVRLAAAPGAPPVATRAFFPGTFAAAVSQKARWTAGIALAGWDRLGWRGGLAERWMRWRDRQSPLAALLLFAGYAALLLWLLVAARQAAGGPAPAPLPDALGWLLMASAALLGWRLAMRFGFTAAAHGWREGLLAMPRVPVANLVAILAAASALGRYRALRRTGRASWAKTDHVFPSPVPAE
jgi:adsorption protein B